jgi:hypothetical protein
MYIDDALRAAIRTRWRADTAVRALPRSRQGEAMNKTVMLKKVVIAENHPGPCLDENGNNRFDQEK